MLGGLYARLVEDARPFGDLGQFDDPFDSSACAFDAGSLDSGRSAGTARDAYTQVSGFSGVFYWYFHRPEGYCQRSADIPA